MRRNETLFQQLRRAVKDQFRETEENLSWLYAQMHPYFFITMKEEIEAIVNLAANLHKVPDHRQIVLTDREKFAQHSL